MSMKLYHLNAPDLKGNLNKYKPENARYWFYLEIHVMFNDDEHSTEVFSVWVASPEGLQDCFSRSYLPDIVIEDAKIIVIKNEYNYNSLEQRIRELIHKCNGRNDYESLILLQRYFDPIDKYSEDINGDYFEIFDKLKKGKK